MILAAGRGERMRPLSDSRPKPLLEAGGRALIVHLVERLVEAGFGDLVINHAWLGEMLERALGNGAQFGARIRYSPEPPEALGTGGGIRNALALLGDQPFLAVNGDIWTDFPFERLRRAPAGLAHLVLVDNPKQHPEGDFCLSEDAVVDGPGARLTFAGIGVYRPELFVAQPRGGFPLAPLLRDAMRRACVTGEHYQGRWSDIGIPERLRELDLALREP